jgi:hypothetical protein
MHPVSQFRLYLVELKLKLFADCFATNRKPALSCYSTDVKRGTLVQKHFISEIPANFRNFLGSCQSVYT